MRVMIIGASENRAKFGNIALRTFVKAGHEVFPVNPHAARIEGLEVFRAIADVPGPIDQAVLYVPEAAGLAALDALAARGDVAEVWLSPGADSDAVVARGESLGLRTVQACAIVAQGGG